MPLPQHLLLPHPPLVGSLPHMRYLITRWALCTYHICMPHISHNASPRLATLLAPWRVKTKVATRCMHGILKSLISVQFADSATPTLCCAHLGNMFSVWFHPHIFIFWGINYFRKLFCLQKCCIHLPLTRFSSALSTSPFLVPYTPLFLAPYTPLFLGESLSSRWVHLCVRNALYFVAGRRRRRHSRRLHILVPVSAPIPLTLCPTPVSLPVPMLLLNMHKFPFCTASSSRQSLLLLSEFCIYICCLFVGGNIEIVTNAMDSPVRVLSRTMRTGAGAMCFRPRISGLSPDSPDSRGSGADEWPGAGPGYLSGAPTHRLDGDNYSSRRVVWQRCCPTQWFVAI